MGKMKELWRQYEELRSQYRQGAISEGIFRSNMRTLGVTPWAIDDEVTSIQQEGE